MTPIGGRAMEPDSSVPDEGARTHVEAEPVVHVDHRPGVPGFAAIVALRGEHDLATAAAISSAIGSIDGNVLVDLSACTFLDSTVIGVLFARNEDLARTGRRLEVVVPPEASGIARTLELVRMHEVIVLHHALPGRDHDAATGG